MSGWASIRDKQRLKVRNAVPLSACARCVVWQLKESSSVILSVFGISSQDALLANQPSKAGSASDPLLNKLNTL